VATALGIHQLVVEFDGELKVVAPDHGADQGDTAPGCSGGGRFPPISLG
jgi:hypothetical protein